MKKISLFLFLIVLGFSCSIVELDDQVAGGTNDPVDVTTPAESEIDLGSQTVPADSTTAALMLHTETSKRWEADEFIIEGAGVTTSLDCRLDDVITLAADGSFEYESGQWACGGEERNAIDRNGGFSIINTDPQNFQVSFTNVAGFEGQTFEGKVWTLEEDVLVVSAVYESNIFGSFTITGRYVSQ